MDGETADGYPVTSSSVGKPVVAGTLVEDSVSNVGPCETKTVGVLVGICDFCASSTVGKIVV